MTTSPSPNPAPFVVELFPAGDGPALRERLIQAAGVIAGNARLVYRAVVVEVEPVDDARPDPVKVRRALKLLSRECGLRAEWHARTPRHPTRPPAKPRKRKRAKADSATTG